jgi:hypothetical protein
MTAIICSHIRKPTILTQICTMIKHKLKKMSSLNECLEGSDHYKIKFQLETLPKIE